MPTTDGLAMPVRGENLQVFFVEDHRRLLRYVSQGLSRCGCTVTSARSLKEANDVLRSYAPDVVLLDLQLPDGRGETLIPTLRAKPNNPAIIVHSAKLNAETSVGLTADVDMLIPKPAALAIILEAIDSVTGRARLRRVVHGYCEHVGLTSREEEAVYGAVCGQKAEQTAVEMGVSEHTLRTHWKNIRTKTRHASQQDVVAAAMRFTLRQ